MSPVALRRVQLRLFKNAAFPHLFALPATGATVEFFRRSAVATAAVEVHEMDTVTVPVADGSGFQAGDPVTALGGPDRDFQVRSVAANSLELDYLGTNNFVLAIGDRIRSFQPLDVHLGEGTAIPPTSSLTVDASGIAQGYLEPERFDYEVSGAAAGSAAGYYADGRSGSGQPATTLNVRDFASVQAAVDALPPWGGTVHIPAGHYVLTETLYLPCDRPCHLVGEGAHDHVAKGTVLEWTANVGMLRVRGDFSSVRGMKLRNTSLQQASREDEGYGIAIGRRDRIDPHPHPEPVTAAPATEYARGENRPLYSVLIEDVVISDSPGWGIHVPGVGLTSDETTEEFDRVLGSKTAGGGTLSFGLQFKRVRVHRARRYGGLFIGSACTTVSFEECDFLHQGAGEVTNSTYYAYLAGCDQPSFERCVFEGFSSADKAWIRLFGTSDAVFDACLFENDPPPSATPPSYFLQLASVGGTPCRGGAIRHCRFVRGGGCLGHMNVLKMEQGGSAGFHIVGSGGVSVDQAWNGNQFQGNMPHFDLGGDSNIGVVVSGSPAFSDDQAVRQFQLGNPPRAGSFSTRSHARMPGSTLDQLFSSSFDDPSIRLEGNLVLNADLGSGNPAVACPMYRLGGTDQSPKWRLVNNAPTLTQSQRDARSNWVQGDMILLATTTGELLLQVRLDSGWKTVTIT